MSELSVWVGCACVRYTALDRKWSPPISSGLYASAIRTSVLLTIVRYFRHGSSGRRADGVRSNALPVAAGDQKFCVAPKGLQPAAPCTASMQIRRVGSAAADSRESPRAGRMASSIGRATVAPSPCRKVRRGRCFPMISMRGGVLRETTSSSRFSDSGYCSSAVCSRRMRNAGLFTTPMM